MESGTLNYSARNANQCGAFIYSETPSPPKTVVDLDMDLDGQVIQVQAEVIWSRSPGSKMPAGMGVRFCEISPEAHNRLKQFLSGC